MTIPNDFMWRPCFSAVLLFPFFVGAVESPSPTEEAIKVIQAVGEEGQGNEKASLALQQLAAGSTDTLIEVLEGMKGASPIAQNWLRNATESLAESALKQEGALPVLGLTEFVLDTNQDANARALALEWLQQLDPSAAQLMLRGMLNDPSNALRSQAVALWMEDGQKALSANRPAAAQMIFRQGIEHARDVGQIRILADALHDLGAQIEITQMLGMITQWHVVGPFHNRDRSGFETIFAPEQGVDLKVSYQGKSGEVSWQSMQSDDRFGMVDLNQPYPGYLKEVTAYAYHDFHSSEERPAQLRLGCKNAWKIWLNGEFIFGRDEYHRGAQMDQYILPAELKKGSNSLLIKLCQNEQMEDWTVEWEFQLRVCDETGKAIHSESE